MWMEQKHYHVRQHDRSPDAIEFRTFWETFGTLAEARDCFGRAMGRLTTERKFDMPEL